MKAIYLDCFAGISGNMLLGAFLQAGVPEDYLAAELKKLMTPGEFSLQVSTVSKNGIMAVYVDVEAKAEPPVFTAAAAEHEHEHGHEHEHDHDHDQHHAHAHHTMAEIRSLIERSALSARVKQTAVQIFQCLAEAEGKVHGRSADEVHFHEVGAVDSIVDIVGTAICLDYLEVGKVFASRVNTGSGFIHCAHGTMMVPAPAKTLA